MEKRILRIVTRRERAFRGGGGDGGWSESEGTGSYDGGLMLPLLSRVPQRHRPIRIWSLPAFSPPALAANDDLILGLLHVIPPVATRCPRSPSAPRRNSEAGSVRAWSRRCCTDARPQAGRTPHWKQPIYFATSLQRLQLVHPDLLWSNSGLPRKPPQHRHGRCKVASEQLPPAGVSLPVWRYTS